MGLLKQGKPLQWSETDPRLRDYVKQHGIIQFLNIWKEKKRGSKGEVMKWGDEVEYTIVHKDESNRTVKLSLHGTDILKALLQEEQDYLALSAEEKAKVKKPVGSYRPEYAQYMVEGTPFEPYMGCMKCLLETEKNMLLRRREIQSKCAEGDHVVTFTMFPLMGAIRRQTDPGEDVEIGGPYSRSSFISDTMINPHPRFGTLTRNIRQRRAGKVQILMPLFVDKDTDPNIGSQVPWDREVSFKVDLDLVSSSPTLHFAARSLDNSSGLALADAAMGDGLPALRNLVQNAQLTAAASGSAGACGANYCVNDQPAILMDAMGFGMGCCCLQCTFQADNIEEARMLYDQLLVLCPLMLAITAATPIVRGLLANSDVRWNIVSQSVDDRTHVEQQQILKSRYDSASLYISLNEEAQKYSDLDITYNEQVRQQLLDAGVDAALARHVSHLFIRDPLVIFDDATEIDDAKESDHWENIQSTNWQTVRFKPPPPGSDIGWRVEFRVMEVQLSDFENAAFMVFIPLLTRAILSYGLNFYMPISLVDENMKRAHKRDGVLKEKFWFRSDICRQGQCCESSAATTSSNGGDDGDNNKPLFQEMSVDEIMNGSKDGKFEGVIKYVTRYLDEMNMDAQTRLRLNRYVELVSRRASGELMTTAAYLRKTVMEHPDYHNDSIVSEEVAYDLVERAQDIASGKLSPPELLGNIRPPMDKDDLLTLDSSCCSK